jgi:SAM-dependent methyltransferase
VQERIFKREFFNVVQCNSCSLVYTNPRPESREILRYYPEDYSPYQFSIPPSLLRQGKSLLDRFKTSLKRKTLGIHYGYFHYKRRPLFINGLLKFLTLPVVYQTGWMFPPFNSNGKILDIGCSTGTYLAFLRELGWDTYGVELNPRASEWAREKLGLNVFTGDFQEADFPRECFDVVTLRHSLEHMHSPMEALKKTYRILQKNGLVIIGVPNVATIERAIFGKWWTWEVPRHLYHFSPATLSNMLIKNGFKVSKIEYQPNVYNIILSLQNYLSDQFPDKDGWIKGFFNPDKNLKLQMFLMPVGYLLLLARQVGRMIVYGRKV